MIFSHLVYLPFFFFSICEPSTRVKVKRRISCSTEVQQQGAPFEEVTTTTTCHDMFKAWEYLLFADVKLHANWLQAHYKSSPRYESGGRALERRGGDWMAHCSRHLHHQGALHTPPIVHQEKSFPAQLHLLLHDWKSYYSVIKIREVLSA